MESPKTIKTAGELVEELKLLDPATLLISTDGHYDINGLCLIPCLFDAETRTAGFSTPDEIPEYLTSELPFGALPYVDGVPAVAIIPVEG